MSRFLEEKSNRGAKCAALSNQSAIAVGDVLLDFVEYTSGRRHARVRREWADAISGALLEGTGCVSAEAGGRGRLVRFEYGEGQALIRRYRRGGVVRHFTRESYLLVNRPLLELRVLTRLFESGFPVPEPLGVVWERRGPLYRGALATAEVAGADLHTYLTRGARAPEGIMRNVGETFRRMHDLGVFHADLQVRNVLVTGRGIVLLDFDNARLVGGLSKVARARNLLRFRRSLDKNGIPLALFQPLWDGYGREPLPAWLDRFYTLKGRASDILAGRRRRRRNG